MTRKLCRHCGRKYVNRPRGLCWECYRTPSVLELYPSTSPAVIYRSDGLDHPDNQYRALPVHQPGEQHYRCFWCQHFRCAEPMRLCADCEAEYHLLAVDMPGFRKEVP